MRREFRARRVLYLPLGEAAGLCIAVLVHSYEIGVPCAIALGVAALVHIPHALSARVVIVASTMTGSGVPPYGRSQKRDGPVQLDRLAAVQSVDQQYGMYGRLGPAFMRPYLLFIDVDGGELVMWVHGWEQQTELFDILREATLRSNARIDKASIRRLHLKTGHAIR